MFNKSSDSNQTPSTQPKKAYLSITGATVQACHCISDRVCVFTLNIPGATFLNLKVIDGQKGMFIAMPQTKGKDGQYYDQYRVFFSDDDTARIIKAVGEHATGAGEKADFKTRYEV